MLYSLKYRVENIHVSTDRSIMLLVRNGLQFTSAILTCCDMNLVKVPDFWIQDCSAASQNILLAAHALGLGAVWVGVHPMTERIDDLRNRLNLPDHIIPFSLIPIGFPDETLDPRDTFREDRIHEQTWS